MTRSYDELITIPSFEERFEYLKLDGVVGESTFGFDRYLNQMFYRSKEWRDFRREIIIRDEACDLAHKDHEINGLIIIHHINPITVEDVKKMSPAVFDKNNVVCTMYMTHNAIHYGDQDLILKDPIVRRKNDTCPWKQ